MQYGGWKPAVIVNSIIIAIVIFWTFFIKCSKQSRSRERIYDVNGEAETEVKLVESKNKKTYMFHNSKVEIPLNTNKLYAEELSVSVYDKKSKMIKKPDTN